MLTVGRIVHFKLASGAVRPAICVQVWSETVGNFVVFLDGANDSGQTAGTPANAPTTMWATSIKEGTGSSEWSWPPRA